MESQSYTCIGSHVGRQLPYSWRKWRIDSSDPGQYIPDVFECCQTEGRVRVDLCADNTNLNPENGGRCTNEALLSIMQRLRCFRLRSVSHITQFAPQIPTLPSWRLQLCVLCEVWLLSAGSDTVALALQFKDADYHKRKAYFKPYRHLPSSSNLNSSVLLSL